jgi:uncharacterized protein (TIGR00369 family)
MTNTTELDTWLAQEAAIKHNMRRGPGAGLADPNQTRGRSGIDILQSTMAGTLPYSQMSDTLDFVLISATEGTVVFQGTPSDKHLNPMGTVHGGWFATLLDSALGCAVWTRIPVGKIYTTAELSVNMVRALTPKVPRVRAIGQVIHCGRQLATAEAKLVGADGTLYAHATTTCLVLDQKV